MLNVSSGGLVGAADRCSQGAKANLGRRSGGGPAFCKCGRQRGERAAARLAKLAASLPQARVEIVDDAGHMLPMTHREAFLESLRSQLAAEAVPTRAAA